MELTDVIKQAYKINLTGEDLSLIEKGEQSVIDGWEKPSFMDGYKLAKAFYNTK